MQEKWNGNFYANIEDLIGKTFNRVYQRGNDELVFELDDGEFVFYHDQDCCEQVSINDICGDLEDLQGFEILRAEESCSGENPEGVEFSEYQESFTWTFYKFATRKGYVDVRWYGESNGYYSESVSIEFRTKA